MMDTMELLSSTSPAPESAVSPPRQPADIAAAMVAAFAARAERAAGIVQRGGVEALEHGRYKVRSGAGSGYFAVRDGYCNCPDFAWRGVVPCKHLIAVEMTRALTAAA